MNRFFHNIVIYLKSSIVRKLMFFYVLIIMIPVLALGVFIRAQSVNYYEQMMSRLAKEYMNPEIENIKKMISEYKSKAMDVRTNTSIKNLLEPGYYTDDSEKIDTINFSVKTFLGEIKNLDNSIYKVRIFFTRNQIQEVADCFYDFSRVKDINWYRKYMEQSKFNEVGWNISLKDERFNIDSTSQHPRMVVSVLLKVYDNMYENVNGLLEIQIKQDYFFNQMASIQSGQGNPGVMIIDGNGNIIYRQFGNNSELSSENWGGTIKNVQAFKDNLPPMIKNRYYTAYEKIAELDCTEICFFPNKEMNRENLANRNLIFLVLFAGFVFLAIITFLLVKIVFSKLKKLLSALKRIQKGDLDFTLEAGQNDEVGELSKNFNIMTGRIKELIQINVKTKLAEKEAQLKALQAQINPHFLYNSLNAIKMMAELKDELAISDAVSSLGIILRYNISGGNRELTSLGAEIRYIKHYIHIQKLLLEDRADLTMTVDPELMGEQDECMIMKLLIQPVLENAIIHGLKDISVKGCVNIAFYKIDSNLYIKIKNNGNMIPPDKLDELNAGFMEEYDIKYDRAKGFGIGIENVRQRIRLFYGEEYGISITSSKETGTEVEIKIPFVTAAGELSNNIELGETHG